jgi:hypothetical protein
MTYPPEEHTEHIDYFGTNLPDTLVHTNSALASLREEAQSQREARERLSDGICALQWLYSRLADNPQYGPLMRDFCGLLGEIQTYGDARVVPDWVRTAHKQMGRS